MSESSKNHDFLRLTLRAVSAADDMHLQAALSQISGQHKAVTFNVEPRDGVYSLEGRAESDLDPICDQLRDEYHLAISVGPPTAVLLETVLTKAEAEGKYIRQIGGSGNYGHCKLRVEPNEPGKGYEFINDIRSGVVPTEYIQPIEQGVRNAMQLGILAGFQMADIKVTLIGGSYHEVDSNEMAFKFAGSLALKEAARKASPVLLEPVMSVDASVPQGLAAATRQEIYSHRGRVESELTQDGFSEIEASVPLSELLVSSAGIAARPMKFLRYEPIRDSGSSDEDASGVTAKKPNSPRPKRWSDATRPSPEDED
jgi:elongation factor G